MKTVRLVENRSKEIKERKKERRAEVRKVKERKQQKI